VNLFFAKPETTIVSLNESKLTEQAENLKDFHPSESNNPFEITENIERSMKSSKSGFRPAFIQNSTDNRVKCSVHQNSSSMQ
jgi:hypothetical protein